MTVDTLTIVLLFAVLGAMVWSMHRTNVQAHVHTQEILRDIARYLGTDRR